MADVLPPESLARCRDQAQRLVKQFRAGSPEVARRAAERFRQLQSFTGQTVDELLAEPARVRLKHALAVIAMERGFAAWLTLKRALERAPAATPPVEMYVPGLTFFLNRWFADYDEARASLAAEGGFLLPYRQHFFITVAGGIRELGLDPDDPDWRRIGFDWVRPADTAAHARLLQQRLLVIGR